MPINLIIPGLGNKFVDYREGIPGDSYNWGPVINSNDIQYFTFHHSVTPQTAKKDNNWQAECDKIANIHINSNGWAGVGYRFIICSNGVVAYVGDLSHGGSAVADKNNIMFSACLVGDFTKELPIAAQVHSAHLLAKFFLTQAPQYPSLTSWDQIRGHKEFNLTACPGSNWRGVADSLYNRIVADKWQGYPDPQPEGSIPPPPPGDPCKSVKKELEVIKSLIFDTTKELNTANEKLAKIKQIINS